MNASMELYLRVFVNPQQDDWVKWLPMAEFTANNGTLETTKCTQFFTMQGTDPWMIFLNQPTEGQVHHHLDADQVQATMEQVHMHL